MKKMKEEAKALEKRVTGSLSYAHGNEGEPVKTKDMKKMKEEEKIG